MTYQDDIYEERADAARAEWLEECDKTGRTCDVREWAPEDGDSRCQQCGHTYGPWVTDNPLWNQTLGGPAATDDPGGLLCPSCFMRRFEEVVEPGVIWRVVPMWKAKR